MLDESRSNYVPMLYPRPLKTSELFARENKALDTKEALSTVLFLNSCVRVSRRK